MTRVFAKPIMDDMDSSTITEIYKVEIETPESGLISVAVTDMTTDKKLTGSTMASPSMMVGILVQDHQERREADPVDQSLAEQKRRRREEIVAESKDVFGDAILANAWLSHPNEAFDGRRPLAVAARDEDGLAAVREVLCALDANRNVFPVRTARSLHVEALDVLLKGKMADAAVARDWDLLAEVARLVSSDAPTELAVTDSSLFKAWREAVTKFHLKGWTNMTPQRVEEVRERAAQRATERASGVVPG